MPKYLRSGLTEPSGAQGAQGFQGPSGGAQGAQGPQGAGAQGAQGRQGAVGGGGGGGAGSPVVRKFPFVFNTPGLLTGHTVYVPTVGDILLDAWVEVDTVWNGTTPLGDVGQFVGDTFGWWLNTNAQAVDMTKADGDIDGAYGLLMNYGDSFNGYGVPTNMPLSASNTGVFGPVPGGGRTAPGVRVTPAKFTSANPVKVCVSQNARTNGADPGSTQGAAVLYLVTVTPV